MGDQTAQSSVQIAEGRRVPRRAVGRIGARALSSVAFGVMLAGVARLTTLHDFGVFMLAYSVGLVIGTMSGLGAPTRVLRVGAEHKAMPGALFAVYAALVGSAFTVCGAIYFVVAPHWSAYAGLLLALGDTLANFAVAHTTAIDRHLIANLLVLGHRMIPLSAVAVSYVVSRKMDFATFSAVLSIPVLVALVIPAIFAHLRESARQWRSVFVGGMGYWVYSISALIGQLQAPILAAVTSASIVAIYMMAAKVVGPISILTASVSIVVVPELVKRIDEQVRFDRLFSVVLCLSFVYFFLVAVFSWPVAELVVYMAGPQYRPAEPIVIGMVIGAGISGCSQAFNARLIALGRPLAASTAIIAGGLISLASLGVIGAAGRVSELWMVPVVTEIVVIAAMVMANYKFGPKGADKLESERVR